MITLAALIFAVGLLPQQAPTDSVTLAYCYEQASENYPIAKNIELQEKVTELNVRIANTGYYPQINLNGRASYQSEVTDFLFPGGAEGSPRVSKDQYEASLNVTQNIFNGGAVGIRKKLEQAQGEQEVSSTKIELHKIRSQIDQIYFGTLLSQKQQQVQSLFLEDLEKRLATVQSQVKNGVLLPSQERILKAGLIKSRQDSTQIASNIRAGYQVLSEIIGEEVAPDTKLALPELQEDLEYLQPQRPEHQFFESRLSSIEQQKKLAATKKVPSLSAFGIAAYGRPGLNFLNDDLHDYYIIGLRLKWNFWDFLNSDREQQALKIEQSKVKQNKDAFTTQLEASLSRTREKIAAIRENIERDQEIIELRNQIVEESASQLENGVITATEYVTESTRARQAQLSLLTNRVRLIQAQVEYATAIGVPADQLYETQKTGNWK